MDKENRITTIIQIFTVFLVIKGLSATYLATKYALQGNLSLVEKYSNILLIISPILILPTILMAIPLFCPISKKFEKIFDRISLSIVFIVMIILLVY